LYTFVFTNEQELETITVQKSIECPPEWEPLQQSMTTQVFHEIQEKERLAREEEARFPTGVGT
jgi:hypothetical protein